MRENSRYLYQSGGSTTQLSLKQGNHKASDESSTALNKVSNAITIAERPSDEESNQMSSMNNDREILDKNDSAHLVYFDNRESN